MAQRIELYNVPQPIPRFRPGQSGNPHGRPRGGGAASAALRDQLLAVVQHEVDTLPQWLPSLRPADRAGLLAALLPYVLPKQPNDPPATAMSYEPPS